MSAFRLVGAPIKLPPAGAHFDKTGFAGQTIQRAPSDFAVIAFPVLLVVLHAVCFVFAFSRAVRGCSLPYSVFGLPAFSLKAVFHAVV